MALAAASCALAVSFGAAKADTIYNEGMTDILVVLFPIGLAAGFAVGYAVRAAISLRHHQAAMRRRYLL
jgi:hypothetical protein